MNNNAIIQINGMWLTKDAIFSASGNDLEEWEQSIFAFLQEWIDSSSTISQQTSGSTGTPKHFILQKDHMINSAQATIDYFKIKRDSNLLLCLPAEYIAGKMMIVRAIVGKCNLITKKPSKTPFKQLQETIDFAAITPMQLYASFADISRRTIKQLLVGGGAIDEQYSAKIEGFNTKIFHSYAMTETCTHVALRALNGTNKSDEYTALEGISFETDNRNCLTIHAPELLDRPLQTNDIVELKSPFEFYWLGRADNIINSGGIKIVPEQIESKLKDILPFNFFISSIHDKELGEKVVLLLEKETIDDQLEKNLLEEICAILPKYHSPKKIIAIPCFVWSKNDKLLRNETMEKAMST